MVSRKLIGLLVVLSIGATASAQTGPAKPAPTKSAAPQKKAPAPKAAPKKGDPPAPAVAAKPEPPPPPTDIQLRTKYTTGAQISENSTYIKGARQRFEFPGITMISQCDLKRNVQLHEGTKHYLITSTEPPPPVAAPAAADATTDAEMAAQAAAMSKGGRGGAPPKPKGGVITETVTLTDTGERKPMFGFEARRIRTVLARQPGEGACETKVTTVETDGWYVDLPEHLSCPAIAAAPPPSAGPPSCVDRVTSEQKGEGKIGFAVSTTITTTVTDAKEKDKDKEKDVTAMSMEVVDLKVTTLDKALFDVPPDYTEVKDYKTLLPSIAAGGTVSDAVFGSVADGTSTVAPKKDGVIRVGVVAPANKSGKELPDMRLLGSMLGGFTKQPFEGLPVSGATAAELDRDAASKGCDYVLVSEIAEIKTSKPNKVGGMLKKVSGDSNAPSEIHDVRVDYKLFAVGDTAKPRVTASAKASSGGGFGVGSALRLAAFAGQMYLTMGMGGGGLMSMMGQGSPLAGAGGLGGGLGGRMNPGMGAAMSIMSAGGSMAMAGAAGGGDASGEKMLETVQDGLSKAGKQISDELKKAKAK